MYGVTIPNPYVEADAWNNWIHAREWPTGTVISLEVDELSDGLGDVDYTTTATVVQNPHNPGDPNDILADFEMNGFTLEVGM